MRRLQQNITLVSASLINVRIFPNPSRSDRNSGPITSDNLPINSTCQDIHNCWKIRQSLSPAAGVATWPLTNADGDKVASGLYLYLVTDSQWQPHPREVQHHQIITYFAIRFDIAIRPNP